MKGVWFSMCFCRITSPLSSVPMSRWMGALSTRASRTRQEDHSRLRPLCYRGVDVFILSSLVSRKSYENVLKKVMDNSRRGFYLNVIRHSANSTIQGAWFTQMLQPCALGMMYNIPLFFLQFSVQSNMGLSTGTTFPSAVHHVLFLAADTCLQGVPSWAQQAGWVRWTIQMIEWRLDRPNFRQIPFMRRHAN